MGTKVPQLGLGAEPRWGLVAKLPEAGDKYRRTETQWKIQTNQYSNQLNDNNINLWRGRHEHMSSSGYASAKST